MSASNRPSRPPLVLIANEHEWSSRSLESVLGPHGYAVLRAPTAQRVIDLAQVAHPDALILDAGLTDVGGVELCARLRSEGIVSPNVPIIITTSAVGGRTERVEAYAAGAWEMCSEPIDVEVLLFKLNAFVQAKLAADRIRAETLVDEETGLYNVRGLARRAREIGGEAIRRSEGVACVVFSPEHEKTGDEVDLSAGGPDLAEVVSRVCRATARVYDAIGRLGPNEYAIIAPSTGEAGAGRIVERLRESFAMTTVRVRDREHRLRLSASVVAVPNLAESAIDPVELLYSATASLHQARGYAPRPPAADSTVQP